MDPNAIASIAEVRSYAVIVVRTLRFHTTDDSIPLLSPPYSICTLLNDWAGIGQIGYQAIVGTRL